VTVADPRPVLDGRTVRGSRCSACGTADAWERDRCGRCLGPSESRAFGPDGTVWSSADVHLAVGHRAAPYTLAYVDLSGADGPGPRVLARLVPGGEVPPGTAVEIVGDDEGDIAVTVAGVGR
jgi:uncharacterized OB-fold protein